MKDQQPFVKFSTLQNVCHNFPYFSRGGNGLFPSHFTCKRTHTTGFCFDKRSYFIKCSKLHRLVADCTTNTWYRYYRRLLLEDLKEDYVEELIFTTEIARKNAKNYQVWCVVYLNIYKITPGITENLS